MTQRQATSQQRLLRESEQRSLLAQRVEELERALDGAVEELEQVKRARAQVGEERADLRARLSAKRTDLASRAERVEDLRTRQARSESRLASLEDLLLGHEGAADATRKLLEVSEAHGLSFRGVVSDVLEASEQHAVAIEALLDSGLSHLIVDDLDHGHRALRHLKEAEAGRAGFVPIRGAVEPPELLGGSIEGAGVVGRARELVHVEDPFGPVADRLLAGAWVVETLACALELRAGGVRAPLVTLDGDVVDRGGVLKGGSTNAVRLGPLAMKNEVRRLRETGEGIRRELAHDKGERNRLAAEIGELDDRFDDLGRLLEQQQTRHVEAVRGVWHD